MTSPAGVIVRPATAEDFDAWFALFEAVAAEGRWVGSEAPMDRDRRAEGFHESLTSDSKETFVADLAGEVVGALFVGLRNGQADLGMFVADGHRGAGIGSALMEACIDWARSHRAHKVKLELWPHNTRARALYEKFGFVEEGRFRREWRRRNGELWDSVSMGLVLDETSPGSPY